QPVRWSEGQGPPDRRHRRLHARDERYAARRPGTRGHAAQEPQARRHLQHGWRGRGELRFRAGACEVAAKRATVATVGWAKRSLPTTQDVAVDGGHSAIAPLPTLHIVPA